MAFDADARVKVIGQAQPTPESPLDQLGSRLRPTDVVEGGVDVEAAVAALLDIRDERDRQVSERDRWLSEQGIVLLKGGQA
jgi:hypothetical protein